MTRPFFKPCLVDNRFRKFYCLRYERYAGAHVCMIELSYRSSFYLGTMAPTGSCPQSPANAHAADLKVYARRLSVGRAAVEVDRARAWFRRGA
jgi:hypothetical protein